MCLQVQQLKLVIETGCECRVAGYCAGVVRMVAIQDECDNQVSKSHYNNENGVHDGNTIAMAARQ